MKPENFNSQSTSLDRPPAALVQASTASAPRLPVHPAGNGAEKEPHNRSFSWTALLAEAVRQPGLMLEAYRRFHTYSIGNQILALTQCRHRGLQPGPLASFAAWKKLGRHVKAGEKGLTLCMPVLHAHKENVTNEDGSSSETVVARTYFVYRSFWFVLEQTWGREYQPPAIPGWSRSRALATLGIETIPYSELNGNAQGYALRGRKVAINPMAQLPEKTLLHEIAHALLHCGEKDREDNDATPRSLAEVEAEAVALICCEALDLEGAEYCRGYIQSWGKHQPIPEASAKRIFHAADQILKAGYEREEGR